MGALCPQWKPAPCQPRGLGFSGQAAAIRPPVTAHCKRGHGAPLLLHCREGPGSNEFGCHGRGQHTCQQRQYDVRDFFSANPFTPGTSGRLTRDCCCQLTWDTCTSCRWRSAVMTPSVFWCLGRGGDVHPLLNAACAWLGGVRTLQKHRVWTVACGFSSWVIKKIIGWFSFFFFFFFKKKTWTFHNSGDSLKKLPAGGIFHGQNFFSPSKFSLSPLKNKDKLASVPAAAFGWRFCPFPMLLSPHCTLLGLISHVLLQRI